MLGADPMDPAGAAEKGDGDETPIGPEDPSVSMGSERSSLSIPYFDSPPPP